MKRMWIVMLAFGCSAGSDEGRPPPPPAPARIHPVAPTPKPVDLALGAGLEVRRPLRDGRLSIVPIVATAPVSTDYLTLHDGVARRLVTVRELAPEWAVDELRIRNKSRQPLFVMSGELVEGGVQDRVLAEDRVIAPHQTVTVKVRCVEHERSTGGKQFRAPGELVELALRRAVFHGSQEIVWAKVDEINQALHLAPRSKTYRLAAALQQVAPAHDRRDQLAAQLAQLPDRDRIVGLAAALDGEVIAIDRFESPELYRQLEGELLGAYVASDDGVPHEGRNFMPDDIRALAAMRNASRTTEASFEALRPFP